MQMKFMKTLLFQSLIHRELHLKTSWYRQPFQANNRNPCGIASTFLNNNAFYQRFGFRRVIYYIYK